MKSLIQCLCLVFAGCALHAQGVAAEPVTITADFIAYLKQTTNPHQFGTRADGRWYPYSSPRGRRIGYDGPVDDKALYHEGLTQAEAENQLRARAEQTLRDLRGYLSSAYPKRPFNSLSRQSREILLDYAFSEGARNLPAAFYEVVMNEKWDQLFGSFMYIRWVEKGWPDTMKNKPFADRWLDPKSRLRPAE